MRSWRPRLPKASNAAAACSGFPRRHKQGATARQPRRVAARARQTCDQAAFQRVGRRSHDDRDALRCALRGADRSGAADYDDIDLRPQQIADQRGYRFDIITIMAKLVGDVAPFDITEVAHPAHEFLAEWIVARGSGPDVPDTRRFARLLRARRERPRKRRAAEKRDEFADTQAFQRVSAWDFHMSWTLKIVLLAVALTGVPVGYTFYQAYLSPDNWVYAG